MCAVNEATASLMQDSESLFPYLDFLSGANDTTTGIDEDPLRLGDYQTQGSILILQLIADTHTREELLAFNSRDAINRNRQLGRALNCETAWEYLTNTLGDLDHLALARFAEGLLEIPEERRERLLDEAATLVCDLVSRRAPAA